MKAILIDPFLQTVEAVELDGSLPQLHSLIDAQSLQLVPRGVYHNLVVDEAGIGRKDQAFWKWTDDPTYLGGKALLCGRDEAGKPVDATIDADEAWADVEFLRVRFAGMSIISQQTVQTPKGAGVQVTYMPSFEPLPETIPEPESKPPPEVPFWTIVRDGTLFVAHRLVVTAGGTKSSGVTLENVDLDTLRSMLPDGLHVLARSPNDDPSLIETWM
jgi:hypothetical protein